MQLLECISGAEETFYSFCLHTSQPYTFFCNSLKCWGKVCYFEMWYISPSIHLFYLVNPNWHELWKQEKCSSLAPFRDIFYMTQWACQGIKLTRLMWIFTSKKIQLRKSDPKSTGGGKCPASNLKLFELWEMKIIIDIWRRRDIIWIPCWHFLLTLVLLLFSIYGKLLNPYAVFTVWPPILNIYHGKLSVILLEWSH